ncbi:DUF502 domain-containing protein [Salinigranum sp. GCM10025319]|uniref:DUF502 domain-containing protein n=1 Tax=Salinigranum sp. GCM10025319 TaxID=3252687 RepID=UPI0036213334
MSDTVRESLITGVAVVVPVLVTTFVFAVLFNTLYRYLALVSGLVPVSTQVVVVPGLLALRAETLLELAIPVVVLAAVFWVGFVVNRSRRGERAVDYFDSAVTRIPGFGSIYESFRQMSDVVLSSDTESFREVKLVEFPHEGSYTLGFVTTETPDALSDPTPHDEMVTMFLPMAPNPVMGGHLVHLPAERVMDVDLTVEEGVQTIVTSGVAIAESDLESGLSRDDLRGLADAETVDRRTDPGSAIAFGREASRGERAERYDAAVDPEFADRPQHIVDRERDDDSDADGDRPAREAYRAPADRDQTEGRPAELAGGTSDGPDETTDGPAAVESDGETGGENDADSDHGDDGEADTGGSEEGHT